MQPTKGSPDEPGIHPSRTTHNHYNSTGVPYATVHKPVTVLCLLICASPSLKLPSLWCFAMEALENADRPSWETRSSNSEPAPSGWKGVPAASLGVALSPGRSAGRGFAQCKVRVIS